MKIDIYHLYRNFDYANFVYPIIVDVLKVWAQSAGWDVRVAVCKEKDVDLETDADVVAFSVYTQHAPAAYRLSRRLRERGKVVVFGGPHFRGSFYQEGLDHCDVLATTINHDQWLEVLGDIEAGRVAAGGKTRVITDVENKFRYPDNFYETFKSQSFWQVPAIPTTLGCPYDCDFCNAYMQGKYHFREVDTIYNELAHIRSKRPVLLLDATFGLKKPWTIELMKRIAPLEMNLWAESTLQRLQDTELLDALVEGGVKWVTIGIESFNSPLKKLGREPLHEALDRFLDNAHERGMLVEGNFICGLDCDGPESFEQVFEFYRRSSLDLIIIDILTPYPNTSLYYNMLRDRRIIDTDWEHYDYRHVVFRPKKMTEDQLIDGFNELYKNLYSMSTVSRKLKGVYTLGGLSMQSVGFTAYNLWSMFDRRRKERALNRNKDYVKALIDAQQPRLALDLAG